MRRFAALALGGVAVFVLAVSGAATADTDPARIELGAHPATVQVGAQLLLHLRLIASGPAPFGRLPDPRPSDARLLPLGEWREMGGARGRNRVVEERWYAVFPGQPGRLRIPSVAFVPWDAVAGRTVRPSPPLAWPVEPIPDGVDPARWLPGSALTLSEAGPSRVVLSPGQTLERIVTLRAEGLPAEMLPGLLAPRQGAGSESGIQVRVWNERSPAGVVGYRSERMALVAPAEGRIAHPEIRIDWWSVERRQARQAVLPAWTADVSAARLPLARALELTATPTPDAPDTLEMALKRTTAALAPAELWGWIFWLAALGLAVLLSMAFWRRRAWHAPADARHGYDLKSG